MRSLSGSKLKAALMLIMQSKVNNELATVISRSKSSNNGRQDACNLCPGRLEAVV